MVPSEASPEASIDLSTRFAVDAVDQVTSSLGNYSVLSSIVEAPDTPPDESSLSEISLHASRQITSTPAPVVQADAAESQSSSHDDCLLSSGIEMTSEIQQSEGSQRMTLREASPMVTTENCARFAVDEVEQVTPSLGDYSVQSSTVEALVSPDESSVDETSHLTSRQTTSLSAETATLVVLTDAAESLTSSHDDSLLSSGIEMTSEILPNEEPESAVLIEASSIETTEIAKESHDRQPIRRPKGEIPEGMLQLANEILSEKLGHTNSTNKRTLTALNAAVYAIAKAITTILLDGEAEKAGKTHQKLREAKALRDTLVSVVSTLSHELRRRSGNAPGPPSEQYRVISRIQRVNTTVDIQRLRIRFKDQLKVVNSEIKTIEQALRRQRERQRGYPAVAREPREGEADVPVAEVREHWKSIIGESQPFHPSDDLQAWSRSVQRGENRAAVDLSEETWAKIFAKIKPWKATGPDGIQGFWWKKIPEARERLKSWCLDALRMPHRIIPNWLCRGKIVLIPKGSAGARGPGDFRPIACLNTCYKVLTAMVAQQILLSAGDVLPPEQVALRKGIWGCTHAHILDQTICKDALRRKNVLHTLWVDMTKAFDSVSHGAIKWILARAGVASPTRRLLSVIMSKQSVRYCGRQNGKMVKSEPLGVRRGVMQGDTLSPLLFCMAIAPISAWLRNNVSPYRTSTGALTLPEGPLEINHLFYMDDLKVYSPRWDDIVKAQEGIQKVAGELGLRMNPSKANPNRICDSATAVYQDSTLTKKKEDWD
ncbi:reverse transcriptase [Cooperia oncophora]